MPCKQSYHTACYQRFVAAQTTVRDEKDKPRIEDLINRTIGYNHARGILIGLHVEDPDQCSQAKTSCSAKRSSRTNIFGPTSVQLPIQDSGKIQLPYFHRQLASSRVAATSYLAVHRDQTTNIAPAPSISINSGVL